MEKLSYAEVKEYIFGRLPMFHRIGAAAYKNNLDTTLALSRLCGEPEKNFPSVHIAGTNGKGSVSNMLAAILQAAGYKTGLFTSPHLRDYRERIRINGEMISEVAVVDFVRKYRDDFEPWQPSFFEWTFALAMQYFSDHKVDIAVVETGMGGRLDSTNITKPILSVISNIGFDHTQFLGDTLPKIAAEKAGIIKVGVPVVVGRSSEETDTVFIKKAKENDSELMFADKIFFCNNFEPVLEIPFGCRFSMKRDELPLVKNVHCSLGGLYQQENLQTLFAAIEWLNKTSFRLTENDILSGLSDVRAYTGFAGRWQVLDENPLTICDTGHNEDGINVVVKQLKLVNKGKLRMVIGMVNDKEVEKILRLLPANAVYYFCRPDIPRGLEVDVLMNQAKSVGLYGNSYPSIWQALEQARNESEANDTIFIGGSTFVVAEVV
jgi:dihydrofolate synthase/folylpolyglutamate synthase